MEKKFFDWEEWDLVDTTAFNYTGVTLNASIGAFNVGDRFDAAFINYETGTFELYRDDEVVGSFKLELALV